MSILYWPELFRQGIDRSRILLHTNLRCECTVSGCWHPVITREQCARTGAEAGGSLFGYRVWRGRDDGGVRYNDFSLRGVAQLGSALRSGRRGPGFKSRLPDHRLQIRLQLAISLVGAFLTADLTATRAKSFCYGLRRTYNQQRPSGRSSVSFPFFDGGQVLALISCIGTP